MTEVERAHEPIQRAWQELRDFRPSTIEEARAKACYLLGTPEAVLLYDDALALLQSFAAPQCPFSPDASPFRL